MKLLRVGFSNYRSIGEQPVFIDFASKVNVFIGPNNAGKSNVLRALEFISLDIKERQKIFSQLDNHKRNAEIPFLLTLIAKAELADGPLQGAMEDGELKFQHDFLGRQLKFASTPFDNIAFQTFSSIFSQHTNQHFTGRPRQEEMHQHYVAVATKLVNDLLSQVPKVQIIPAIRKVDKSDQYGLDGSGAIETLAKWRHPDIGQDNLEKKLLQVQDLLRRLLKMPNVTIEVPDTKDKIIVCNNGLRLPLESYGTGIHELLILAIDIFSKKNIIFCVEEPEIHLHPRLQREFMRYLVEETNNQYILATHAHSLMTPSDDVAVTHLWLEEGVTISRRVESTQHSLQVLSDLGVAASDLLQANSVIWVEGPSDRVYINRWLNLFAPDLREGIDYSIMFYGGRLLSHLSLEENEFPNSEDMVPLLRMNQNSCIVIDSDRSSSSSALNATKVRVVQECNNDNTVCWVTDGREIENYLPSEIIEDEYEEMTGIRTKIRVGKYGRLEQALEKAYEKKWRKKWSYNKAKVAHSRRIAARFLETHFSDELREVMEKVIAMIRSPS